MIDISATYTNPIDISLNFEYLIKRTINPNTDREELTISKKIRTISSGAANGAYHGWSVYCSTKSAVDSMTKVIGVEQISAKNPVHALASYPGVVDTDMQSKIRNSSSESFSNVERFIAMKENNELASPDSVAQLIYEIDTDNSISNGEIVDVRK